MSCTNNNAQGQTPLAPTKQTDPTIELARRTSGIEISGSSNHAKAINPSNQAPQLQHTATVAPTVPQTTTTQAPVGLLSNPIVQQTDQNRQNGAVTSVTKTPLVPNTQNLLANNLATSPANFSLLANNGGVNYSAPIPQPPYPQTLQPQIPVQPYYLGGSIYQSAQIAPNQYYQPQMAPYLQVNNTNNPYLLNGGFAPAQFPQYSANIQPANGYLPATFQQFYGANTLPPVTYVHEPAQVLVYAFYIPLELKINGKIYYAVKIGAMDPNKRGLGARFDNLKVGWRGTLRLPTAKKVKKFYESNEDGDDWEVCLGHLNLAVNHVMFLLNGMADSEHTIRAGLLARFSGFALPSQVISSMLAAIQNQPFPDLSNAGHTEFIALSIDDITVVRNAFVANTLSIISHPVQLLVQGRAIKVKDTSVLDFNDEDEDDEAAN